jgi:hypothetical protein
MSRAPSRAVWVLVEGLVGCTAAGAGLEGTAPGLSLAEGTVETATDRMLLLRGPDGEQRVSLSIATAVGAVGDTGLSDLSIGSCVVGRGPRDRGGRLKAQGVTIVPVPAGGCFGGNAGVGALSFVDPRSGVGAPGVGGAPRFPPPPLFMPSPPAGPPEASPTPSRLGIGPQPTPVARPSPAS